MHKTIKCTSSHGILPASNQNHICIQTHYGRTIWFVDFIQPCKECFECSSVTCLLSRCAHVSESQPHAPVYTSGTARANWFASNTMCPTKLRKKIKHVRLVFLACLRGNCCTRDNHWFEIQLGRPGHKPYSLETARKAWQSMKYANEQMHATMEGPTDDL